MKLIQESPARTSVCRRDGAEIEGTTAGRRRVGNDNGTSDWVDLDVFEPEIVKTTICENCNK